MKSITVSYREGEPVQVGHVVAASPALLAWSTGYTFVRWAPVTGCAIVRHVGGTFDGCEVRFVAHQVRPIASAL
jgi:hypothetical protein